MLWILLGGDFHAVSFMKSPISSLGLSRKQTICTHSGKARCAGKHALSIYIYTRNCCICFHGF